LVAKFHFRKNLLKLTQWYIEQFGNYKIEDGKGKRLNINWKINIKLMKNHQDNGGLAHGYDAYIHALSNNEGKSNNQRLTKSYKVYQRYIYFIWIKAWCSKGRPESIVNQVLNSKKFAESFKCKLNSPLNPEILI